jgi:hypothetical protein
MGMTEAEELAMAKRILGWVFWRSRHGVSSFKRSERDAALSDINYWTEKYCNEYKTTEPKLNARGLWCGDRP